MDARNQVFMTLIEERFELYGMSAAAIPASHIALLADQVLRQEQVWMTSPSSIHAYDTTTGKMDVADEFPLRLFVKIAVGAYLGRAVAFSELRDLGRPFEGLAEPSQARFLAVFDESMSEVVGRVESREELVEAAVEIVRRFIVSIDSGAE